MSKGPLVRAVSLALLASVALAPTPALAQRGGMSRGGGGFMAGQTGGGGGFVAGRTVRGGTFVAGRGAGGGAFVAGRAAGGRAFVVAQPGSRAFVHGKFVGDSFHRRHFFHRPFNSFGTVVVFGGPYSYWPPPYYGAPYPYYEPSPVYAPPAMYDSPYAGGTLSLTPPAPSTPSVVQFPTGRYELRGDGITEPYRWVWIPNPPKEPPAAPPPEDPSSPVPPTSGGPGPTRHAPLYRWTDEQGTIHVTDRWSAVPDRYRAQVKRGESS